MLDISESHEYPGHLKVMFSTPLLMSTHVLNQMTSLRKCSS